MPRKPQPAKERFIISIQDVRMKQINITSYHYFYTLSQMLSLVTATIHS